MAFDRFIIELVREYQVFVINAIMIISILVAFITVCGCIRFGIAIYRRKKGIYPPAASQMEDH